MNRRDLLRGLAGVAGGLVLPASVADVAAEVERRYWSLGAMPGVEQAGRISDAVIRYALLKEQFADGGRFITKVPYAVETVEEWVMYHTIAQVTRTPGPAPDFTRWTFGPGREDV